MVQHHLDVPWHDYVKRQVLEKVPDLHRLSWDATKQAAKVAETTDIAEARKLLDLIDRVDEARRATGGEEETRLHGRAAAAA
jgi:Nickel-containing superoxide dismutase